MKLIFQTFFLLALLLGFFSSSINAVSEFYCFIGNCHENSIKDVLYPSFFSIVAFFMLHNCLLKPSGETLVDRYVIYKENFGLHFSLDFVAFFSVFIFVKVFFPESFFVEKVVELPLFIFISLFIFLIGFVMTRLIFLKLTQDSKNTDSVKNYVE
jgi:hypothetical protein